jgi:hypothetical protein
MNAEKRLERYAEAVQVAAEGNGNCRPRLREVIELLREGLTPGEIAERMGMTRGHVYVFLNDPTGAAEYARKHKRNCEGCGTPINTGSPGRGYPERFCATCAPNAYALWTPEGDYRGDP